MLVLSRKQNEVIVAGNVRIQVLDIRSGRVQIGIDAPASVPVDRLEIFREKTKGKPCQP